MTRVKPPPPAKRPDPDSGNAYGNVSLHLPTSTPAGSCRFIYMPPVPLHGGAPGGMGLQSKKLHSARTSQYWQISRVVFEP